jgi:hypothetical protein
MTLFHIVVVLLAILRVLYFGVGFVYATTDEMNSSATERLVFRVSYRTFGNSCSWYNRVADRH